MPFVTMCGSDRLTSDITKDQYDYRTGELTSYGNDFPILTLTAVDEFDFDPNGEKYKEIVWRGQPIQDKLTWNDVPVFRLLSNRFTTGWEWIEDQEERLKTDWGRFMRDRAVDRTKKHPSSYFYEPDIEDILFDKEKKRHYPLWVLKQIKEWGLFEQALKTSKVMLPGKPMLTEQEYERIIKALEARIKAESNDNVPGNTKQSTAKAG